MSEICTKRQNKGGLGEKIDRLGTNVSALWKEGMAGGYQEKKNRGAGAVVSGGDRVRLGRDEGSGVHREKKKNDGKSQKRDGNGKKGGEGGVDKHRSERRLV